jgi:hypothetical protein
MTEWVADQLGRAAEAKLEEKKEEKKRLSIRREAEWYNNQKSARRMMHRVGRVQLTRREELEVDR